MANLTVGPLTDYPTLEKMKVTSILATCAVVCAAAGASASTISTSGTVGVGEVATFEFTLGAGGTFLDLTTNGSTDVNDGSVADTEMALYFGTGLGATLVAAQGWSNGDDDDGFGANSTLTYGVGSGMELGDPFELGGDGIANGEDGALPAAGVYTVVIGEFQTFFSPTIGAISNFGDEAVNYELSIISDAFGVAAVPLPAGLPLLLAGLGGLAGLRLRKKRAS